MTAMAETRIFRTHCSSAAPADVAWRRPNTAATPARAWAAACGRARSSRPPEDQGRVADLVAAVARDERDLGVLDLTIGRIRVAHLPRALDHLQHALDMCLRELPARGVGRQASAHAQR